MHFKEIISRIDSSGLVVSVGFEFFLLLMWIIYAHIYVHLCMFVYGQKVKRPSLLPTGRGNIFFLVQHANNLERNGITLWKTLCEYMEEHMLMSINWAQSTVSLTFLNWFFFNKFGGFCFCLSSLFKNRLHVGWFYVQFLKSM